MSVSAGTRFGPYEIVSLLGAGGMGEVYRARDTRLGRDVAVKLLPPHLTLSPEARQRFEREARAIAALSHPNICALYDVGREGEADYLVMELLEGNLLSERLANGPLPLEQTLRYGVEIAAALGRAHLMGFVHRDLKPGNVMLTSVGGEASRLRVGEGVRGAGTGRGPDVRLDGGRGGHARGTILGTLAYMAPEQLEGRKADTRTDIFAFGAVLYEMATGRKAFSGSSRASRISAIMTAEPEPISVLQAAAPPALDRLVRTCLAKDPEDRWQSAHDVARELKWIAAGGSRTDFPAPFAARRGSRKRAGLDRGGLVRPRPSRVALSATPAAGAGGRNAARLEALDPASRREGVPAWKRRPLAGRNPPRIRRPGRGREECPLDPPPRFPRGPAVARHREGLLAVLVAGQPLRRLLHAGQAEEDRRVRRPAAGRVRRAGGARRHLESRRRHRIRSVPHRRPVPRLRGRRSAGSPDEARSVPAREFPSLAQLSSPMGAISSSSCGAHSRKTARSTWGPSIRTRPRA